MGLFLNYFTIVLFPLLVNSLSNNNSDSSLDVLLQDFALKTIAGNRPRTGVLYKALLPPGNLSGVQVSVLRIRSRGLWKKGAEFGRFDVPPGTASSPRVRRLALVCQDLGNLSSQYYAVPGHTLVAPVVSLAAFDVSGPSGGNVVALSTTADPISIRFPESSESIVRCVKFDMNGTSHIGEMSSRGLCRSREGGHFSVVVEDGPGSPGLGKRKQRTLWRWWLGGFVLGFAGLALAGLVGVVLVKLLRTKKIQIMERQAGDDPALPSRWVGRSKMPSAAGTRTLPSFENGCHDF